MGFCSYVPPVTYMPVQKPEKPKIRVGKIEDRIVVVPTSKPAPEKPKPKVGAIVPPVMHTNVKPEKPKPKVKSLVMPRQHTKPKKPKPKHSFIKSQTIWSSSEDLYVTIVRLHGSHVCGSGMCSRSGVNFLSFSILPHFSSFLSVDLYRMLKL